MSYRDFALTFGPGVLGNSNMFRIHTSGFPGSWGDTDKYNRWWKRNSVLGCDDETVARRYDDVPRFRRLHLFCGVLDHGDQFGWDPTDVTVPDEQEYGIYIFPSDLKRIVRVASTFRQFVVAFALGGDYERHTHARPTDPATGTSRKRSASSKLRSSLATRDRSGGRVVAAGPLSWPFPSRADSGKGSGAGPEAGKGSGTYVDKQER